MSSALETLAYVAACWTLPVVWGAAVHYLFESRARARSNGSLRVADADDTSGERRR